MCTVLGTHAMKNWQQHAYTAIVAMAAILLLSFACGMLVKLPHTRGARSLVSPSASEEGGPHWVRVLAAVLGPHEEILLVDALAHAQRLAGGDHRRVVRVVGVGL